MSDEIKKYANPGFNENLIKKMRVNRKELKKNGMIKNYKLFPNKDVLFSDFPFHAFPDYRFIYASGTDLLQYVDVKDDRYEAGLTYEELLEINDYNLAVSKIEAKTGYKGR